MSPVLGVVPAAGRSSRIGNPKPLLDADGATFLERTVGVLREGGASRVVVGVREDRGPIHATALRTGAHVLVPEDVEDGPITSVRAALDWWESEEEGSPEALLLLPVDHPKVEAATVAALLRAFQDEGASLVLPVHGGHSGHPVLFAGALLEELREEGLEEGARTVVHRHREAALEVEVSDRGVLVDIDTLPEYRRHFPQSYRKRFQKW